MPMITLSEEARNLLRRRASGEQVEVTPKHVEVTPMTLDAYRERAEAGVMYPLSAYPARPGISVSI